MVSAPTCCLRATANRRRRILGEEKASPRVCVFVLQSLCQHLGFDSTVRSHAMRSARHVLFVSFAVLVRRVGIVFPFRAKVKVELIAISFRVGELRCSLTNDFSTNVGHGTERG